MIKQITVGAVLLYAINIAGAQPNPDIAIRRIATKACEEGAERLAKSIGVIGEAFNQALSATQPYSTERSKVIDEYRRMIKKFDEDDYLRLKRAKEKVISEITENDPYYRQSLLLTIDTYFKILGFSRDLIISQVLNDPSQSAVGFQRAVERECLDTMKGNTK